MPVPTRYATSSGTVHELAPGMDRTVRCGRSIEDMTPTTRAVTCGSCINARWSAERRNLPETDRRHQLAVIKGALP